MELSSSLAVPRRPRIERTFRRRQLTRQGRLSDLLVTDPTRANERGRSQRWTDGGSRQVEVEFHGPSMSSRCAHRMFDALVGRQERLSRVQGTLASLVISVVICLKYLLRLEQGHDTSNLYHSCVLS